MEASEFPEPCLSTDYHSLCGYDDIFLLPVLVNLSSSHVSLSRNDGLEVPSFFDLERNLLNIELDILFCTLSEMGSQL